MKVGGFDFPDDLKYMRGHVWVRLDGKDARLGVTSLGASLAKEIVHVDLPADGEEFSVMAPLASYETIKSVSEILAPFKCKVSAVNEKLLDDPSLMNSDPYGGGWVLELEKMGEADSGSLLSVSEAAEYFGRLLEKEKKRFAGIYED